MSLQTWMDEYYPVPAEQATSGQAAEHPLKKWRGLELPILEKHGLKIEDVFITDGENSLGIDQNSCALCQQYLEEYSGGNPCIKCPLYRYLGQSCDSFNEPYDDWVNYEDPEPMIRALEAAVKIEAEQSQ